MTNSSRLTPTEAQQMLAQANQFATRLPVQIPAMLVCFAGLCAAASMSVLAQHLVATTPSLANGPAYNIVIGATIAWIVPMILPLVLVHDRVRRGTAGRWRGLVSCWVVLWTAGTTNPETNAAYVIAGLFAVLFTGGFALEWYDAKRAQS